MPTTTHALEIGYQLDEYVIGDVLGSGGFGITYQATDSSLQRQVAIKEYFLRQVAERRDDQTIVALPGDENAEIFNWGLERFLSEARILAQFEHPNIVKVTRYLQLNGSAYLVMNFEEGETLESWLRERKEPLPESEITAIIEPILDGLEAVHAQGLIHRDVKPSNIMIRRNGTPVLIDFGSARPKSRSDGDTLTVLVTPGYAPPEQYDVGTESSPQGPWTDVYAIAGVMYRIIAGRGPIEAPLRTGTKILTASIVESKGLNESMLSGIDRGLALDASTRPQSIAEFRTLLCLKDSEESLPSPVREDKDKSAFARLRNSTTRGLSNRIWALLLFVGLSVPGYMILSWSQNFLSPTTSDRPSINGVELSVGEGLLNLVAVNHSQEYAAEVAGLLEIIAGGASGLKQATQVSDDSTHSAKPLESSMELTASILVEYGDNPGTLVPIADGSVLKDGRGRPEPGDRFKVLFNANCYCFIYIFGIDATGYLTRLFPDAELDFTNPVSPHQSYSIPGRGAWWGLDEYRGVEQLFFVSSYSKNEAIEQALLQAAKLPRGHRSASNYDAVKASVGLGTRGLTKIPAGKISVEGSFIEPTRFTSKLSADLVVNRWFVHE